MSVMTSTFKTNFHHPKLCTYCGKGNPVIYWQMHYNGDDENVNPKHHIIGMAFCQNCAIELVAGMMRDISNVNRGMEHCDLIDRMRELEIQQPWPTT